MTMATPDTGDARRRLAIYLRDHFGGAGAGVALIRRCRQANAGTEFETVLADLEREIEEDRESLRSIMTRLGVQPSRVKMVVGRGAELLGRLKTNGHLTRYSRSSRVVELEGMAAGVATKRNLWRALVASDLVDLSAAELSELVDRATDQLDRLLAAHEAAATLAFRGSAATAPAAGLSRT
jgi:hypothetical protein